MLDRDTDVMGDDRQCADYLVNIGLVGSASFPGSELHPNQQFGDRDRSTWI